MRPFGCAEFIRDFLLGLGPLGSPKIDPNVGAPQSDIFHHYKETLVRNHAQQAVALEQERRIRKGLPALSVEEADHLLEHYLEDLPRKSTGATYHSFVVYFSNLQRLGWVQFTGREEPSALQRHHRNAPPRKYFRLTDKGRRASLAAWSNPLLALYGDQRGRRGRKKQVGR